MKLKEYRNSMSQIKVSHEKKEELWKELQSRELKQEKKHFYARVPFQIALGVGAFICIFLIMNHSVALAENSPEGIIRQVQEFFHGILKKEDNNIINQSNYSMTNIIEQNIYCDENEHVRMEVLEQLSDGITVLLTVRYTGLDEEGIRWISANTENGFLEKNSRIMPVFPDNDLEVYGVNYSSIIDNLPEMNTETERYFYVSMQASGMEYMSGKVVFRYRMPEDGDYFLIPSQKEVELDACSDALDFVVYEIKDNGEHPYCKLQYLYVSGLSYIIYGKVQEDYETEGGVPAWSLSDIGLLCEEGGEQSFLMNANFFVQNITPKEENRYSDIIYRSGSFYESEGYNIIKVFDPHTVRKLVFYDEDGEHMCDLIKLEEE